MSISDVTLVGGQTRGFSDKSTNEIFAIAIAMLYVLFELLVRFVNDFDIWRCLQRQTLHWRAASERRAIGSRVEVRQECVHRLK